MPQMWFGELVSDGELPELWAEFGERRDNDHRASADSAAHTCDGDDAHGHRGIYQFATRAHSINVLWAHVESGRVADGRRASHQR